MYNLSEAYEILKYLNLLIVRTRQMHDRDARSDSTPETVTVSSGS